jgi:hypothetical protein
VTAAQRRNPLQFTAMGSIGARIPIRRLRAEARPPADLHRALWTAVDETVRENVMGAAGEQVLALYLGMVASDGFADGAWGSSDSELRFSFTDSAGLCTMSSHAALHWLDVVLWTEPRVHAVARAAGWEVVGLSSVPSIRRALEARTPTFVELRDVLYWVSRRPAGARVDDDDWMPDDGLPRLRLAELAPDERVAVEAAAYAGFCGCEYCRGVLPYVRLEEWGDGRIEDVAASWTALDAMSTDDARDAIAAFAEEQWRQAPFGPPELQRLRDALAAQGLAPPIKCLVPMLLQRPPR